MDPFDDQTLNIPEKEAASFRWSLVISEMIKSVVWVSLFLTLGPNANGQQLLSEENPTCIPLASIANGGNSSNDGGGCNDTPIAKNDNFEWINDTFSILTRCNGRREKGNWVVQMKHFHIMKKFGFSSIQLTIETVLNRFQKYWGQLWSEICSDSRKRKSKIHGLSQYRFHMTRTAK